MKISGPVRALTLQVTDALPMTTYLVRFQNTGNGRTKIMDLITDHAGNAMMHAPENWGSVGYKGSAQIVGGSTVDFFNSWDSNGELVMMTLGQPAISPLAMPVEPDFPKEEELV